MVYDNNNGGNYGKYFVQTNQSPAMDADFKKLYDQFAKRILWMDGNVEEGAFQMNTAWYLHAAPRDPMFTEHKHDDTNELIGFIGTNPDDPYNLNGKIEFSIEGEAHLLTHSTMIWVPAGLRHNPMRVLEVNKPIFHFSIITTSIYTEESTYK